MIQLASIDFAKLIQYAAQKMFYQHLNRPQINKILFFCMADIWHLQAINSL